MMQNSGLQKSHTTERLTHSVSVSTRVSTRVNNFAFTELEMKKALFEIIKGVECLHSGGSSTTKGGGGSSGGSGKLKSSVGISEN